MTMQYKCIRGVVTSKGSVLAGELVELEGHEAVVLMAQGKIAPHHEEEIRTTAVEDVVTQTPRRGRKTVYGR
jgi:hypothetical protein